MADDINEFEKKITEFQRRAREKAEKNFKRVCLKAFQNIVQRTPVLTGCARGNWRVNFGKNPLRTFSSEQADQSGSRTISSGSASILGDAELGVRVNIVNSTPYIQRLEHGYSVQAPSGMVHITVSEIVASGKGKILL